MSGVKYCFACGASLSMSDLYCYKCGKKQVYVVESELAASKESVNGEHINDSAESNIKPETEKTEVVGEKDSSGIIPQPEVNEEKNVIDNEKPKIESNENIIETKADEPVNTYANNLDQQQKFAAPQQPLTCQSTNTQQAPNVQQATPVPAQKKKKFPWFFTVLWLIMFTAVGFWGYLYFFYPNYDYPIFTEDAQRFVLFTVAVASLIYTLSLKLSMKKFKAVPAILMVVLGLVIFVFFCLIELQEGDLLHDMVSDLVENVIPVSGE